MLVLQMVRQKHLKSFMQNIINVDLDFTKANMYIIDSIVETTDMIGSGWMMLRLLEMTLL